MKLRLLTAAAALAFVLPAAAQAPAGKAKAPALTFQTAPFGKLLDDFKAAARAVGGDDAVKQIDQQIKQGLGEKGFTGLDLTRPIVGYTELTDKAEASGGVVAVPITDEKEFLDFLKRAKVEVSEGTGGLYKITQKEKPAAPKEKGGVNFNPDKMRFKDRHAYFGANVPDEALAADRLVPASELVIPNETAEFAYRVHIDRIPAGLKKQGYEAIDKAVAELQKQPGGPQEEAAKKAAEAFAKFIKRAGDRVLTDGDIAALRVRLDPGTAELALEGALSAKKGSPLAQEIAARKPTTNRFAGLVSSDAAAGLKLQAPLAAAGIQDAVVAGLEQAQKQAGEGAPPEAKPVLDELIKGAIRTVKSGELDLAAALTGPDKDNHFTAVLGLSFDDPSGVEKALRDLHKTAPEQVKSLIKLDVAKVNGVSVHRADVGPFLPPEAQSVFGDKAAACLAFAPKGVYVTFGPNPEEAMTAALKVQPAESKALDVVVNPSRLHKLVTAIDPQGAPKFAQVLGTDDKQISALSASIEGGDELRVRLTLNLKLLPRAGAATMAPATGPGIAPPATKEGKAIKD